MTINQKQCTKCGEWKPLSGFRLKHKGYPRLGHLPCCRSCLALKTKEWRRKQKENLVSFSQTGAPKSEYEASVEAAKNLRDWL